MGRKGRIALLCAAIAALSAAVLVVTNSSGFFCRAQPHTETNRSERVIKWKDTPLVPPTTSAREAASLPVNEEAPSLLVCAMPSKRPIERASIWNDSAPSAIFTLLGKTDVNGLFRPDATCPQNILVTADGYVPKREHPQYRAGEACIVQMLPSLSISGQVHDLAGRGVSGIQVLGWSWEEDKTGSTSAMRAIRGDPTLPLVESDENGYFVIPGIDPSKHYCLAAGGEGMCSIEKVQVPQNSGLVHVAVGPVYGARVHFTCSDGAPAKLSGLTLPTLEDGVIAGSAVSKLEPLLPGPLLAGIPAALFADERIVTFYYRESNVPTSVAFTLASSFPGYQPIKLPFEAAQVASGGIPSYEVTLIPTVEGFGTLDLEVLGLAETCSCSGARLGVPAILSLDGGTTSNVPIKIQYRIDRIQNGHIFIDDIPFGSYVPSLAIKTGFAQGLDLGTGGDGVLVGPSVCSLQASAAMLGSIALRVLRSDGSEFDGALLAMLSKPSAAEGEWQSGGTIAFGSAPYVICGVHPGSYVLFLVSPSSDADPNLSTSIEVTGGAVVSADLRLK